MMVNHAKTVTKSDFIFYVRSTSHLERRDVLKRLVGCGKSVVTPKLKTYDQVRHARLIRVHESSKWNLKFNQALSFTTAATSTGNTSEIGSRIRAGVNFLTIESHSKFWFPIKPSQPQSHESIKL